ncbi:MAG: hypothetical protein ABH821_06295 [archaeon]
MIEMMFLNAFYTDVRIALTIIFFVWLFGWAKSNMNSAKIAVLIAIIITYLIFYKYPEVLWAIVILFLFVTFGKEFITPK